NCAGEPIYDPNALSHHEFEMTFYDTLDEEPYVVPDYDGTPHRPLGLRITRTVYSTFVPPCSYTYWIRYRIVNIGNNFLRNVYVGHMITSGVGRWGRTNYPAADGSDDVAGYEPTHEVAYVVDNDARDYIGSEWVWTSPHIAGLMYLLPNGSPQHPSFNWWISAIDAQFDYGPSWEDHVQWPDTAWMRSCDAGRYFVLSNGEIDFDQVRVNDLDWIAANPQGQHTWRTPDFPLPDDLANGFDVRALYSVGPFGEDMGSYRLLLPSDSFDVWMAIVGGRNFHDSRFPQPPNGPINPDLFNWDDLFYHADIVRNGLCVPWLEAGEGRFVNVPARFTLDPLWPNPFNARANIRFHLDRVGEVTIRAYDVLGRSALEITRETFGVGTHTIAWNAAGMPSGLYFIEARNQHGGRAVQKAVLVK
ncbi:T9SS type A sorting domain-containing protein, partial [bacterium]|nr:T9SS type A sorting domain-containing protein [bacterium]